MNSQQHQERKAKLEDCLNHVTMQFRKLRVIHDKVVEITSQMEEPQEQVIVLINTTYQLITWSKMWL